MEAQLRNGTHLVVDRYSYSGVAYSAAKGRTHLAWQWCAGMEQGLLAPDAVFFLHIDAATAQQRCAAMLLTDAVTLGQLRAENCGRCN